ncbi:MULTISPECIES: helix-turn-helix domain-containing protein [Xenorhabdus]|uniref:helix-turn-helix domain-containing protein n=1 Tax=Xenorhabdus TaxID=626 RepID=UPI000699778C|nr:MULTISPECIES: helix-turn-helix transcriptional regulator [Xenorhabdus]
MLTRNISYLMTSHEIPSVKELAKRLEINQPTLHRTLSGEVKDPSYSMLKNIAEYFGRTATDLMECDLSEIDGGSPYIHTIDGAPEPKFKTFPPVLKNIIVDTYKEIVIREARLSHESKGTSYQTARLENLAENLVKGFSKLIES